MSKKQIELPRPINRTTVEMAHRMAIQGQERQALHFCETGMRVARAQDPKLLLVLDRATEILHQMAEEQSGQTRREAGASKAQKVTPTEVQLWREAYKLCDAGEPIRHFAWIYGAAAWLAGLQHGLRQ